MEKNEQNYFHNMTDSYSFDFNIENYLDLDEKENDTDIVKEKYLNKKDDYFSSVPMNDNSQQKDFITNINQINIKTSITSRVPDYKVNENKEPNDKKAKKNLFIAMKKKKRGKKPTKTKRIHSKDTIDLVEDKLQVNYINYLVDLGNDMIKSSNNLNTSEKFLKIKYEEKKKSYKPKDIRKLLYNDIFKLTISNTNKKKLIKGKTNEKMYEIICKELPILKEIFDLRYSYIFQNYYLKNLREFNLNGLDIKLSEETKTYNDLLQKDQNYNIKNVFEKVINRFYCYKSSKNEAE
jgi:hypothetical protein